MRSLLSIVAVAASVPANELACLALSTARIRTQPSIGSRTGPSSVLPPPGGMTLESTAEETLERTAGTGEGNLSPFLQGMVDEQRELQMNVGKAMDVLRKDYPYFLKRAPDFSIYHDSIKLSASDGQVQLSKLSSYKRAFSVMRTMLSLVYDPERSVVQSRMVYDSTRTQIRVSFNAMLVPKLGPLGGRTLHVDGISVYSVDLSPTVKEDERGDKVRNDGAGKVVEHRLERVLVNGQALQPPYFNAFGMEMVSGRHAGALAGAGAWT